ncbi:MAG TPA: hypothetical protein VGL56_14905 [Fimbriimonadaceae bacterium]
MKPIYRTYPIERIDEDERVVEGYAFVNEVVPGEGGIRLKRSAMEAATADYLANGTSRELHQPSAAGKPLSVLWDEKGALLRVKVVDDRAWSKVKEGVYKGFSVGVIPEVMRGKDVEKCNWWDTSLVDVGKDKDARFTVWRVEGMGEGCVEDGLRYSALGLRAEDSFEPEESSESLVSSPGEAEGCVLRDALGVEAEPGPEPLPPTDFRFLNVDFRLGDRNPERAAAGEAFGQVVRSDEVGSLSLAPDFQLTELSRVQRLQEDTLRRAEAAESRLRELERMPRSQRPVLVPELITRTMSSATYSTERGEDLQRELEEISRLPSTSDKQEAERRILEIQRIKRELA